jgi:hypothetical protein
MAQSIRRLLDRRIVNSHQVNSHQIVNLSASQPSSTLVVVVNGTLSGERRAERCLELVAK